jgi:hypothetical protein
MAARHHPRPACRRYGQIPGEAPQWVGPGALKPKHAPIHHHSDDMRARPRRGQDEWARVERAPADNGIGDRASTVASSCPIPHMTNQLHLCSEDSPDGAVDDVLSCHGAVCGACYVGRAKQWHIGSGHVTLCCCKRSDRPVLLVMFLVVERYAEAREHADVMMSMTSSHLRPRSACSEKTTSFSKDDRGQRFRLRNVYYGTSHGPHLRGRGAATRT